MVQDRGVGVGLFNGLSAVCAKPRRGCSLLATECAEHVRRILPLRAGLRRSYKALDIPFDLHRGAVCQDFRNPLHHFIGIVAHGQNRVGAVLRRVL